MRHLATASAVALAALDALSVLPYATSNKLEKACVAVKLSPFPISVNPRRGDPKVYNDSLGALVALAASSPGAYMAGRHPISSAFDITPGLAKCGFDDPKCQTDYWQRKCATSAMRNDRAETPNVTVIEAESYADG